LSEKEGKEKIKKNSNECESYNIEGEIKDEERDKGWVAKRR